MKRHFLFLLILLRLPTLAHAEGTLAAMTPADAGLCLEATDLAASVEAFVAGPLYSRLEAFEPWQKWKQKNAAGLADIAKQIGRQLGVEPEELWRGVIGNKLLLAVWPASEGAAHDGLGLLLVEAEDPEFMDRLAIGFRASLTRTQGLQWSQRKHVGYTYFQGATKTGKTCVFVVRLDRVGALTNSEAVLRRLLELQAADSRPADSLAGLAEYQAAAAAAPATDGVRVFVNPRVWDATLLAEVEAAPEARRSAKQRMLQVWRSLEFGAASFQFGDSLTLRGLIKFRPEAAPPVLQAVLQSLSGELEFLDRAPADCLMAVAGRFDVVRLVNLAQGKPRPEQDGPKSTSPELLNRLLRLLGAELGGYAMPAAGPETLFDWVGAVRVQQPAGDDSPPVDDLLETTLPAALNLLASMQSPAARGPLARLAPPPVPRFFATRKGFLLGANTRQSLRVAQAVKSGAALGADPRLRSALSPPVASPTQIAYFDLDGLRQLLERRQDDIVKAVSASGKPTGDAARRGLRQLLGALRLADTLILAAQVEPTRIGLLVSICAE